MKSYDQLKTQMDEASLQKVESTKKERLDLLKNTKILCKESDCPASMQNCAS